MSLYASQPTAESVMTGTVVQRGFGIPNRESTEKKSPVPIGSRGRTFGQILPRTLEGAHTGSSQGPAARTHVSDRSCCSCLLGPHLTL